MRILDVLRKFIEIRKLNLLDMSDCYRANMRYIESQIFGL